MDWLTADLAVWKKANPRILKATLRRWLGDPGLGSIRAEAQLKMLAADEQKMLRDFWQQVRMLSQ